MLSLSHRARHDPGTVARLACAIPGLHDHTVLRRLPAEALTAMRFDDLLARFDEHSQHYEVLERSC